jgi:hypothetical protein
MRWIHLEARHPHTKTPKGLEGQGGLEAEQINKSRKSLDRMDAGVLEWQKIEFIHEDTGTSNLTKSFNKTSWKSDSCSITYYPQTIDGT